MAIIDVVCKLLHGRPVKGLLELNFREIESFLRDENHKPCFSQRPDFFDAIEILFMQLFWQIVIPSPTKSIQAGTYLEEIEVISTYFNDVWNIGSLTKAYNLNIDFIALENNLVILEFNKSTEEKMKLKLCDSFSAVISHIIGRKSIKVVAQE